MTNARQQRELQTAFEQYSDELFHHCLMRLSERERALEITQETFLRASEYSARGVPVRRWRSFLYRILNNLIVDEYRRKRTLSLESLLASSDANIVETESVLLRDDRDVLEEAMVRFDAARACKALETLPSRYRDVLTRRFIDGLSPTEIAARLKESENAVSVRIHRALRKLRSALEGEQSAYS